MNRVQTVSTVPLSEYGSVAQGLEREVLDDVGDPGDRHRLVGAADAEDQAGLERALDSRPRAQTAS